MIGISSIYDNLSTSKKSHKTAWARLKACQLSDLFGEKVDVLYKSTDDWDNYDKIFLYHGMAFDGQLNLFGGANSEKANLFNRLISKKRPKLISLDIPMPDYGTLCKGRLSSCSEEWKAVNWDLITDKCKIIKYVVHPIITDSLVIGDSHSFSMYRSGYMVARKDGRTLQGVLKKSILQEIKDFDIDPKTIKNFTGYWGNIDVRHHLIREVNPIKSINELISNYEKQLLDLEIQNIELVHLLPVEDESRKIPKTGYFKNSPFFGSQKDRANLVDYFNNKLSELCDKNCWNLFTWPQEWYTIHPKSFMDLYMEKPKSVHISPEYHRWNYDLNSLNKIESRSSLNSFLI